MIEDANTRLDEAQEVIYRLWDIICAIPDEGSPEDHMNATGEIAWVLSDYLTRKEQMTA